MSIPYTREVGELVTLFSPTAAQAAHIAAELTPTGAQVRVQMRGRIFDIAMTKANPKPYGYGLERGKSKVFADFGELKEAIRAEAEAIIEKEGENP